MRTWAEIDLSALEHNYRTLRAMLPQGCRFLGLCKANAYGHGAAVIGHTLERLGADMLAVACVSEAEELKGLDGPGLEPVMAVKSRVAAVRSLPKGTPVSYGRTAVLERDSRIAVVPVGYGDGYPRSLSNRMVMRVRGVECPIVGRVCMDMCMLDVTGVPGVQAGDVAVVYDGPLLERAAQLAGTIPYELMCDVNPRVPRVYLPEDRAEA